MRAISILESCRMKKRSFLRTLRFIPVVALALLLFISGATVWLTHRPGERWVRKMLEAQLTKSLGQPLSVDSLETNLFTRLDLYGIVLHSSQTVAGQPPLLLQRAMIRYRLSEVISGKLSFRSVALDSLALSLTSDSTGIKDLPFLRHLTAASPSARKARAPSIHFGKVKLTNASLTFREKTVALDLDLDGLDATFQARERGFDTSFQLDTLRLKRESWRLPLTHVSGSGNIVGNVATLDSATVTIPGIKIGLSGELDFSRQQATVILRAGGAGTLAALAALDRQNLPQKLGSLDGEIAFQTWIRGKVAHPDVSGWMRADQLKVTPDFTVERMEILGGLRGTTVYVDSVSVRALDGALRGQGRMQLASPYDHSLQLALSRIDAAQLWKAGYGVPSPFAGIINGSLTSSGPLAELSQVAVNFHFQGDSSRFHGKELPPLSLDGTLQDGRASLRMVQGEAALVAEGWTRQKRVGGSFRATFPSIAPFTHLANLKDVEGKAEIEGLVTGSFPRPDAKVSIRASSLSYRDFPVDTLAAFLRISGSEITLDSSWAELRMQSIDTLRPPFGIASLSGQYQWSLRLAGSLDHPQGRLQARFQKPSWGGTTLDEVQCMLDLDGQKIHLLSLLVRRGAVGLQMYGEWDIDAKSGEALASVYTSPGLMGREALKASHYGISPFDTGSSGSLGLFRLQTRLFGNKTFAVHARGENVNLQIIAPFVPQLRTLNGMLNLVVDAERSEKGTRSYIKIDVQHPALASVQMDSFSLRMSLNPALIRLDTLNLVKGDSCLRASGTLELPPSSVVKSDRLKKSRLSLNTDAQGMDLRVLAPLLPASTVLRGFIAWQLQLSGTVANPQAQGTVRLTEGYYLAGGNTRPLEKMQLMMSFANKSFVLKNFSGYSHELPFALRGKGLFDGLGVLAADFNLAISGEDVLDIAGTTTRDSVAATLNSRVLNLSSIAPLLLGLEEIGGYVTTNMRFEGPWQNPSITGWLSAHELEVKREKLGLHLSGGSARVRFESHHVAVDTLRARLNGGQLLVNGDAYLFARQIQSATFDARLNNIQYERPKIFTATIDSAELTYERQNGDLHRLSGLVAFGDTRILANLPIQELLDLARQAERPKPEYPPLFQKTTLNVRVVNNDQFWVNNNLARIRQRVNLDITGPLLQPSFSGRVAVQEGYLIYFDRKFEISTGILDFADPRRINPIVSLTAVSNLKSYQTRDRKAYRITFTAQGPLDQAQIDLRSDPPLDRSDIMALLILGSTRQQLTSNITLTEGNTLVSALQLRAENLSSERISGYISNRVGSFFGLEEMSIEGNLFSFSDNWGPQLLASKQVGDRTRIIYSTRVGHLNEQGIRLDYEFTNRWSIESQADQQGGTGVDIKYRVKFK